MCCPLLKQMGEYTHTYLHLSHYTTVYRFYVLACTHRYSTMHVIIFTIFFYTVKVELRIVEGKK